MNQISKRIFALVLAMAMACALVMALVACNGGEDKDRSKTEPSLDGDVSPEMQAIANDMKKDISLFCGYLLTEEEKGSGSQVGVHYLQSDGLMYLLYWQNDESDESTHNECAVYYFFSEEDANQEYESLTGSDDEWEARRVGKNIVISNTAFYDQIVSANAKPRVVDGFEQYKLEYLNANMYTPAPKNANRLFIISNSDTRYTYLMRGAIDYYDTDIVVDFGIISEEEFAEELNDAQEFLEINYTSDSYIKPNKSQGVVEYRLKDKPGWHLNRKEPYDSHGYGDEYEGEYKLEYYWDGTPINELTVPAQFAGREIKEALFWGYGIELDTLTIEEGLLWVDFYGCAKTVNLPNSLGKGIDIGYNTHIIGFNMYYNTTLEVINFNGAESELLGISSFTRPQDYETDERLNIAVTVNFNDGTSKVYGGGPTE